jgi:hypothetical protein
MRVSKRSGVLISVNGARRRRESVKHNMNDGDSRNEDRALKPLLTAWKIRASLPPRFQDQVWQRIARAQSQPVLNTVTWSSIKAWISGMQLRPALAAAYVAAFLAVGAMLGWSQAQHATAQASIDLSARYMQSVNPYQARP